jgi:hypothetical protein
MAVLDKTVHHLRGKLREVGIVPVELRSHSIMHQGCLFPLRSHVRVALEAAGFA